MLSDKETIEACITKAIDGGWEYPFQANCYEIHKYVEARPEVIAFGFREEWQDEGQHLEGHWSIPELIFNHDFAEALWGDMSYAELKGAPYSPANITREPKAWQYHLQQLAIAEDRISYLRENA